jgi:3-oxoacyl-[acyl-carrier protein] reductase
MVGGVPDIFDIAGRSAIVTGGANGMGKGIVEHFVAAGVKVTLCDLSEDGVRAAADAAGGDTQGVVADVSDEVSVRDLVARHVDRWGAPDFMVNAAGIMPFMPLFDVTVEQWDRCHAVNLRGTFLMLRETAGAMRAADRKGAIVNIASIASLMPFGDMPAYASSKGGVLMLTRNAALDLAPYGIRVNAILPGGVLTEGALKNFPDPETAKAAATERVPLGRYAMPADIAGVTRFLVSEAASFITGQGLIVDGGRTLT